MKESMEFLQSQQVCGDVFTYCGVRAPAGLNRADAPGFQGLMVDKKLSIFLGEDVIGHNGDAHLVSQFPTQREHERSFAAADWSAHTHGEGAPAKVTRERTWAGIEASRMIEVLLDVAVRCMFMRLCWDTSMI